MRVFLILTVLTTLLHGNNDSDSLSKSSLYTDSLNKWIEFSFKGTGDVRYSEVVGERENRDYYAAAFKTIRVDNAKIRAVLQQFDSYGELFSSLQNVKEIRRCESDVDGCWYFELRVFPFRYASIVTPVQNKIADSCSDLKFKQVEDSELIDKYRKDKNNFFLIKDRGSSICFKIKKVSEKYSRIGIIITSKPDVSIPPWLYKMGVRVIVPGFLNDLEKYLRLHQ